MTKIKFGYKDIDELDKPKEVNDVFTSVSNKYDVLNDIMSFGLHRLWKKQFIRLCNIKTQKKVLDIACGTGDIALELIKKNPSIDLTCLDPNREMIEICKEKFINKGITNVDYQIKTSDNPRLWLEIHLTSLLEENINQTIINKKDLINKKVILEDNKNQNESGDFNKKELINKQVISEDNKNQNESRDLNKKKLINKQVI